jgi:hypothetical protein
MADTITSSSSAFEAILTGRFTGATTKANKRPNEFRIIGTATCLYRAQRREIARERGKQTQGQERGEREKDTSAVAK